MDETDRAIFQDFIRQMGDLGRMLRSDMNRGFDRLDARLERVETEVGRLGTEVARLGTEVARIGRIVDVNIPRIQDNFETLGGSRLEQHRRIDDHERRLHRIELHVGLRDDE